MSDTPRTDALWLTEANSEKAWYRVAADMRDHSRDLERELAAVTKERDRYSGALRELWDNHTLYGESYELIEQAMPAVRGGSHE